MVTTPPQIEQDPRMDDIIGILAHPSLHIKSRAFFTKGDRFKILWQIKCVAPITKQDVGQITEDLRRFYLSDGQACGKTTPNELALLIDRLADLTEEVRSAARGEGSLFTGDMLVDSNVAQFSLDMAHWQQRLAHYRRAVEAIPQSMWGTPEGCVAIYKYVTAPLIDGIFYEMLPGISLSQTDKERMIKGEGHPSLIDGDRATLVGKTLHPGGHSGTKPPDFISPFTLGNQVIVYREHQTERLNQLWEDLKSGFKNLVVPSVPTDWLRIALMVGGGVILTGGIIGWLSHRKKDKPPPSSVEDTLINQVENPQKPKRRSH